MNPSPDSPATASLPGLQAVVSPASGLLFLGLLFLGFLVLGLLLPGLPAI